MFYVTTYIHATTFIHVNLYHASADDMVEVNILSKFKVCIIIVNLNQLRIFLELSLEC